MVVARLENEPTILVLKVKFNFARFAYEAECNGCGELVFFMGAEMVKYGHYLPPRNVLHYDCEFLKNGK